MPNALADRSLARDRFWGMPPHTSAIAAFERQAALTVRLGPRNLGPVRVGAILETCERIQTGVRSRRTAVVVARFAEVGLHSEDRTLGLTWWGRWCCPIAAVAFLSLGGFSSRSFPTPITTAALDQTSRMPGNTCSPNMVNLSTSASGALMLLAESDTKAEAALKEIADQSPLPLPGAISTELARLDSRNIAGEARTPNVGGRLPTTFVGCPDTVIDQIKRCRVEAGVGVLDLFFQTADSAPEALVDKLTMFGEQVLPRIREV